MTAPLFGFQWNQTTIDRRLQRGLFSIFARNARGVMRCLGTGFVVESNGHMATGCTAAHVLNSIREIREARTVHATLPDILRPEPPEVDLALRELTLILSDEGRPQFCRVLGLAFDRNSDIAMLQFERQRETDRELDAYILADDRLPEEETVVSVVTYFYPANQPTNGINRSPMVRVGRVTRVLPDGFGLIRAPCVETNIPVFHGMSGSPAILHVDGGQALRAFGFVSTDLDPDGPNKDRRDLAGRSILGKLPCEVQNLESIGSRQVVFSFNATYSVGQFRML